MPRLVGVFLFSFWFFFSSIADQPQGNECCSTCDAVLLVGCLRFITAGDFIGVHTKPFP